MSCGGRVYKGDTVTISVPFDIEDYSNLVITYTTIGNEKIEKTQDEVEIEDGFITYTFEPGELDLLPDGVIYYTITYEVDGVPNVDSTNTNLYLKTPAGYSGITAEDIYMSGYTAGLEDCGGDCVVFPYTFFLLDNWDGSAFIVPAQQVRPNANGFSSFTVVDDGYGQKRFDQGYESGHSESAITDAYQSGYTAGYEDAEDNCPSLQNEKNVTATTQQLTIRPDVGYDGMRRVNLNAQPVFNSGFQSGYSAGQADCPECSGGSCNLITGATDIMSDMEIGFVYEVTASQFTPSGDGFSSVVVTDLGFGQAKYDEGYSAGYEDGLYQHCDLVTGLIIVPSGSTGIMTGVTPPSAAGFSSVSVNATEYGQEKYTEGYDSGYTDGYAQGQEDCPDTCNIENDQQVLLYSDWTGETVVEHSEGYDGLMGVTIQDFGYGQAKYESGYTVGYDEGYLSGASTTECSTAITMAYNNGRIYGYTEGKDSVIKSLLTENDTELVIAYYYTSATQLCLITGEYHDSNIDYDGNSSFVSMSVNGYSWQPVQKYLILQAGWTQIRFSGCTSQLNGAFSHRFTPASACDIDALKVVSVPSFIDGMVDTHTFHGNDGLRAIASSCGIMRGATSGADNINVLITHYKGNQREYQNFPSSGVLFIPEGSSADWSSVLSNWLHIEMV